VRSRAERAGTVYCSAFVQGLSGAAFPASAVVLRARGMGDAAYGSLFLAQMSLAVLGAVGAPLLLARLGLRRGLTTGGMAMALSAAALLAAALGPPAQVYAWALAGTALLGAGAGVSAAPLNAYPQLLFPGRAESAVVVLHTISGVGLAFAPALGAAGLGAGAWPAFPVLLLLANVVVAVLVERGDLPEPPHGAAHHGGGPARSVVLWAFVAIAWLYGVTESVFGNWAIVFLTEERGVAATEAGTALAAFWAALTLGRVSIAALVWRVRADLVLPVLAALMSASALLVPLVSGPADAALFLALGGFGCSAVFPLALGLACARFPAHRAWVSSAAFAGLCAGLGTGSLAAGLLRPELTLAAIYRLAAAPPALACGLALVLLRGRRALLPSANAAAPANVAAPRV
jgi:fucose permease